MDQATLDVLKWLCRDFRSTEFWKQAARKHFLAAVVTQKVIEPNGQEITKQSLKDFTAFLQDVFEFMSPTDGKASLWNSDFTEARIHDSVPPAITNQINWEWIADYFLLAASLSWKEYEMMNSERQTFNFSQQNRCDSCHERTARHTEFIRRVIDEVATEHHVDFDGVTQMIRDKHYPVDNKTGKRTQLAQALVEFGPTPLAKNENLPPIPLYCSKYFPDVNERPEEKKQSTSLFE